MTQLPATPRTDLKPVAISSVDADAADARAHATRLSEAARLAALPGVVSECTASVLKMLANTELELGNHTPNLCIERRCPDTGTLLVETLALMPVGPDRGHVAHVVLSHPALRPYRIETPLDLGHNGSTRPLCPPLEGFLARWPERSHAVERLLPLAQGMVALATRLEAGRRLEADALQDEAVAIANAIARLRSHARAANGEDSPWTSFHIECPSPWTRADANDSPSSRRSSSDRSLLTTMGRTHLQTILPSICSATWKHHVPTGTGSTTSRLRIEPLSIFVIPNPHGGTMEQLRDSALTCMPPEHFALA